MTKRQKKKWANWWRRDLYKFCRRYPKEGRIIILKLGDLMLQKANEEQDHE